MTDDTKSALPHLASPAGDVAELEPMRHAVADAINRARYQSPQGGLPERGVAEEDASSREYAYRLADAAMTVVAHKIGAITAERDEARRHIAAFKDNLEVAREAACKLEAERDALAERLQEAVAAEREACAKLVEKGVTKDVYSLSGQTKGWKTWHHSDVLAAEIRARAALSQPTAEPAKEDAP